MTAVMAKAPIHIVILSPVIGFFNIFLFSLVCSFSVVVVGVCADSDGSVDSTGSVVSLGSFGSVGSSTSSGFGLYVATISKSVTCFFTYWLYVGIT